MSYRATQPPRVGGFQKFVDYVGREYTRIQRAFSTTAEVETGEFTPTFNFVTPGDLSVSYTVQEGYYHVIGPLLHYSLRLFCTPTWTTGSGDIRIEGLPYECVSGDVYLGSLQLSDTNVTYPTGRTYGLCFLNNGQDYLRMILHGSATNADALNSNHIVSGSDVGTIRMTGFYPIR